MARLRRPRKRPLTNRRPHASVSHRVTKSTISSFHSLSKQRARLESQLAAGTSKSQEQLIASLQQVNADFEELGGLVGYQDASRLGQTGERGGDSSKILIEWLRDRAGGGVKGKGRDTTQDHAEHRLRMLEIGALIPTNYATCSSWIENLPMDLHSQHPNILEQDFFERPVPKSDAERFEVISCSLVLNFIADPRDRGRMLLLLHEHLRRQQSSLLFLVLPLPCLTNSRFISGDTLRSLMAVIGFELIRERWRKSGRVGYWLWGWRAVDEMQDRSRWEKRTLENDGARRNNFAILLPRRESSCPI